MIALIVGGAKSGKSMFGQNLAKALEGEKGTLYYVATMNPYDLEDLKRIENHLKDREGYGFKTIEKTKNIRKISKGIDEYDTLLIDSITSIVTNSMFIEDKFIEVVNEEIIEDIKCIAEKASNVVLVTDYVFCDGIIYDCYTDKFRRELGVINRKIAEIANIVVECSYGNIICHKGKEILEKINEEIF